MNKRAVSLGKGACGWLELAHHRHLTRAQLLPKNLQDAHSKWPILEDFHRSLDISEWSALSSSLAIYLSQTTKAAWPSGPLYKTAGVNLPNLWTIWWIQKKKKIFLKIQTTCWLNSILNHSWTKMWYFHLRVKLDWGLSARPESLGAASINNVKVATVLTEYVVTHVTYETNFTQLNLRPKCEQLK